MPCEDTSSNMLPLFSLFLVVKMGSIKVCMDLRTQCAHLCICSCCCEARPDGSPSPGGTALVNNSVEAHYQGSADLSLIPP